MVAFVKNKHLRLVGEAPEGGGVHDAVAIALEGGAHRTGGFVIKPPCAQLRPGGMGASRRPADARASPTAAGSSIIALAMRPSEV